jgi:hypothetical protein
MIHLVKKNVKYNELKQNNENATNFKVVIVLTNPGYRIKCRDYLFTEAKSMLKLLRQCKKDHVGCQPYHLRDDIIFISIPDKNNHQVVEELFCKIHAAALGILGQTNHKFLAIHIHEHAACFDQEKCIWKDFIRRLNDLKYQIYRYRFVIVEVPNRANANCEPIGKLEYYCMW